MITGLGVGVGSGVGVGVGSGIGVSFSTITITCTGKAFCKSFSAFSVTTYFPGLERSTTVAKSLVIAVPSFVVALISARNAASVLDVSTL